MLRRAFLIAGSVAVLFGAFAPAGSKAQDYPSKPVEFIVPWGPGGDSDVLMRIVASELEKQLGKPVPVINMPGASGTVGLREAARKKADGYTIAQVHDGLLVSHHTGLTELNWSDFTPVGQITSSSQMLVVRADSPWQTIEEFAAYAKENPGAVKFGVTLAGVPHLHAAMIAEAIGTEFSYVGYEGTSERIRGLLGGTIDAALGDIASAREFVRNGDLRFLAVGSAERIEQAPDVPTFQEKGYDLELSITRGIVVPKGTPPERIAKLEEALGAAAQNEELRQKLRTSGAEVVYRDEEAYTKALEKLDAAVQRLASKLAS